MTSVLEFQTKIVDFLKFSPAAESTPLALDFTTPPSEMSLDELTTAITLFSQEVEVILDHGKTQLVELHDITDHGSLLAPEILRARFCNLVALPPQQALELTREFAVAYSISTSVRKDIEVLRQSMKAIQEESDKLEQTNTLRAHLVEESQDLNKQLSQVKTQLDEKISARNALNQELHGICNALRTAKNTKKTTLKTKYSQNKKASQTLNQEIDGLSNQKQALESKKILLDRTLAVSSVDVKRSLDSCQIRINSLQQKIDSLESEASQKLERAQEICNTIYSQFTIRRMGSAYEKCRTRLNTLIAEHERREPDQ